MNFKTFFSISISTLFLLSACTFNYNEAGKKLDLQKDLKDFKLAKKAIRYISENKRDSVKSLLNKTTLILTPEKTLDWLFENGIRVIEYNNYPADSIISVSYMTEKTLFTEEISKEFSFPFINTNDPKASMTFKITISNGEIEKLMLSTGKRFY